MPAVSERFKTYHEFASASLVDIYGDSLKKALMLSANHLESGVWMNTSGAGQALRYEWLPLPWDAQLSPVNDVVASDFNGDGRMELVLAQNHFTNWIETGYWRGNPGCHLEWGHDGFRILPHRSSGILMPNDTKSLILLDVNGDGQLEILAAQNNQGILQFQSGKK